MKSTPYTKRDADAGPVQSGHIPAQESDGLAEAIRQLIAECATHRGERRVNPDRRAGASNAGQVIVVVGNGNIVAPAQSRATSPRRSAEFLKAPANRGIASGS